MKQRQTKRQFLWLEDMAQLQTWLEDQAAAGWVLESSNRFNWGKFRRTEPRRLRYRAEPLPKAFLTATWDEELEKRREIYEGMGWTYAGRSNLYFIFRTEDLTGPELYDHEMQAENWDKLVKARGREFWGIAVFLAVMCGLLFWIFAQKTDILLNMKWNIALLYLTVPLVVWNMLRTGQAVRRQRKKFRSGAWEQYSPYPSSRWAQIWQTLRQNLVLWLCWFELIARFFLILDGSDSGSPADYPEARYLPLEVLAEEVEPDQVSVIDHGKNSILAQTWTRSYARCYVEEPQVAPMEDHEAWETYWEERDRYFVETEYYDLRGRWAAELVAEKLAEELFADGSDPVRVEIPGADEAWYRGFPDSGRERLIVRREDRIMDILCGENLSLYKHYGEVAALLEER